MSAIVCIDCTCESDEQADAVRRLTPAVEAILAARLAEQAEQIAQAIEATDPNGSHLHRTAYHRAARIARNHGATS